MKTNVTGKIPMDIGYDMSMNLVRLSKGTIWH